MKESEKTSFRKNAIELLELLSSLENQLEYQENVPIADVPSELVCMWFDDFYHLTEDFKQAFSASELEVLASFNKFYEFNSKKLPSPEEGLKALQSNESWLEIAKRAKATLNILQSQK